MSTLIRDQVEQFIKDHPNKKFSYYEADPIKVKKIADRFNEKKTTNVKAITNLDKFCTYTVAALAVGDMILYNELIDQLSPSTVDAYEAMFSEIELQDECYDIFETKDERLLHYSHPELFEILRHKNLKYKVTLKKESNYYDVIEICIPDIDFVFDVYHDDIQDLKDL